VQQAEPKPPAPEGEEPSPPVAKPGETPVKPPTPLAEGGEDTADEDANLEKQQEKRRERIFTLRMALITAGSALLGAFVGGFFTFSAFQLQSQRQLDAQQISLKKDQFASFLTDEVSFAREQLNVLFSLEGLQRSNDRSALTSALRSYNVEQLKFAQSAYLAFIIDSPKVEKDRLALTVNNNAIDDDIRSILRDVTADKPITDLQVSSLRSKMDRNSDLLINFSKAAQADLIPPHRGILDIFD
jgi:hypothetical protein